MEYRFNYNDELKIADVAHTLNGEIKGIYEICHTHKTCSENRPEPWVEIDAISLLSSVNTNNNEQLIINCIRCEKCEKCIENEISNLKIYNLNNVVREKYIRFKLGQKIYPTPNPTPTNSKENDCENYYKLNNINVCKCDKCTYLEWYKVWKREGHLRIDFDAGHDITNNKKIIDLFSEDFINKKIVIHSWKGAGNAYVIDKLNYNKYDYWKETDYLSMRFPCDAIIDITGKSTIGIIILLIEYCEKLKQDINKYKFITKQVSIFSPCFPDTTKITQCETDETDISICSDIIVDCENNFTSDEKNVIDKFNINNIEDLIRNDKISKYDKQRCLKCFKYVRERYELMGIEPYNGNNSIQLEKYLIALRILPDGIIKYFKSMGETNIEKFTIIGMA